MCVYIYIYSLFINLVVRLLVERVISKLMHGGKKKIIIDFCWWQFKTVNFLRYFERSTQFFPVNQLDSSIFHLDFQFGWCATLETRIGWNGFLHINPSFCYISVSITHSLQQTTTHFLWARPIDACHVAAAQEYTPSRFPILNSIISE